MSLPARDDALGLDAARWLTRPEGLAAVARATQALDADGDLLAIGARLRGEGLSPAQAAAATGAAEGRRRARATWPEADRLLFAPAALEQASHPAVSAWRARRFAGADWVVDACCGLGGDALALAASGSRVAAVDRDPARLVLLAHNAEALDRPVEALCADALTLPVRRDAPVHVDPSRRVAGRRSRRLADYRPAVPDLLETVGTRPSGAAVVLSPGLDWKDPDLPADAEIEFVQLDGQLLEAVAWLGPLRPRGSRRRATILPDGVTRVGADHTEPLRVGPVGTWLVEPAPAAVRARLHDQLGAGIGARRLALRSGLLTCDEDPGPSPWWHRHAVEALLPLRPRSIRRWLRAAPPAPVELCAHGDVPPPERLWVELGRPPRGPRGRRLHLVRLDAGACVVATRPAS